MSLLVEYSKSELIGLHKMYMSIYDMYSDTIHNGILTATRAQLLHIFGTTTQECIKTACMCMIIYKDNVYDIEAAIKSEQGE